MAPGSVKLDELSTAAPYLRDPAARTVHYDYGLMMGLSFLDGSLAVGGGRIQYDRRSFRPTSPDSSSLYRDSFGYVALQPIASIRSGLKGRVAADTTR